MLNLILFPIKFPLKLYGAALASLERHAEEAERVVAEAVREFERNMNEAAGAE